MNRQRTRVSAWWALLCIVFAQLATAAYACPLIEATLRDSALEVQVSIPCPEMAQDPADASTLCVEHCKGGHRLVDTHPPVDLLSPSPVFGFFVATLVAPTLARAPSIEPILARAAAPPIFASSHRLRI